MATALHRLKGTQFFDNNGNLLAGGKFYFFEANTTNLQTTYSDAAGMSANSNPITLDAFGRLPVSIYFGDSDSFSDYKELLTDGSDDDDDHTQEVTITNWPIDNLPAAEPIAAATAAPPLLAWTQVTNGSSPVTLTASDAGKAYEADTTSGDVEFDLPSAASIGDGNGFWFKKMIAANSMIIDQNGSETIDNSATALTITRQYQVVGIFSNGAEWYKVAEYLEDVSSERMAAASDDAQGAQENADQSEMETGTSTALNVTPGRQHYHPAHPKAFADFDQQGTQNIKRSYGVSSITDQGTGSTDVNFSTSFSDASYAHVSSGQDTGGSAAVLGQIDTSTKSVSALGVQGSFMSFGGSPTVGTADLQNCSAVAFGDQ